MNRRALLRTALVAAGALVLGGHTPYVQWTVYRRKHLLIGSHRADLGTWHAAQEIVALLEEHLPEARARVARAPNAGRLASLIGTHQLEVAVLGPADAAAMAAGEGPFAPYGPVELALLSPFGRYALVSRRDFPPPHARAVASALALSAAAIGGLAIETIDWHPALAEADHEHDD
jgi:hypothetical protein